VRTGRDGQDIAASASLSHAAEQTPFFGQIYQKARETTAPIVIKDVYTPPLRAFVGWRMGGVRG